MTAMEQRRNEDAALVDQDDRARSMVERVCGFLDAYARSQSNGPDSLWRDALLLQRNHANQSDNLKISEPARRNAPTP